MLDKNYEPAQIEGRIYASWLERDAFAAEPDHRPAEQRYVVMMPLPNVTGALHMGHAMDNVMQDLLVRWHRMRGFNTLWMPGTDHAGIATQAVIEKRLKELEGLTRHDIGREQLVERIWRWKDQYEARIVEQQQRMGCSCDWQRQRFTMDAVCRRAVRSAFFRMFSDGLIFRGKRLVNWDVYLQTSVSDDEVYHETVAGSFWHLRYPVIDPQVGEPDAVIVATTRPETMLGDTAVAVHPDPEGALQSRIDKVELSLGQASAGEQAGLEAQLESLRTTQRERLPQLLKLREMAQDGRCVRLPLLGRPIPLICDEWPKPELGSGCVKITPAHDANDYAVWQRHRNRIEIINILNTDGTLNAHAGPYQGLHGMQARQKIVADLEHADLLERVEDRQIEIGHSDRSKTPIEPFLSDQWFVRMGDVEGGVAMGQGSEHAHRSPGLVQAAIDAVGDGRVAIHPHRYTKTYLDWLAEKRDWPISRQLWWGHRIPVWSKSGRGPTLRLTELSALLVDSRLALRLHLPQREFSVGLSAEGWPQGVSALGEAEAWTVDVCPQHDDEALQRQLEDAGFAQDPDVLDTWFSSALWPFSTLGWPDPQSAEVEAGSRSPAARDGAADALAYYYPGSCLVTGRDIITLWVARMVIAGLYNLGQIPFRHVFIHANIQDGKGERMSKSKGNGIDPVDIIDRYGADAMRYVLCEMQTGAQDIRLPVSAPCPKCGHSNDLAQTAHGRTVFTYLCGKPIDGSAARRGSCGTEFDVLGTLPELPAAKPVSERFDLGRAFCTKLWNSARFALSHLQDLSPRELDPETLPLEDRWILHRLDQAVVKVSEALEEYNPGAAIQAAREFFWSELCDWYLELIKARLSDKGDSRAAAQQVLAFCLDQVLRLLHPFMPFISEHLWQKLGEQVSTRGLGPWASAEPAAQLINASWPQQRGQLQAPELDLTFGALQAVTRAVREVRASASVAPRQLLQVTIKAPPAQANAVAENASVLERLAGVAKLVADPQATRPAGAASKLVAGVQVFVHDVIDDEQERTRLQRELSRVDKEISTCQKKLANPKFVDRAPAEVVQEQRNRLENYRQSRTTIEESLAELGSTS